MKKKWQVFKIPALLLIIGLLCGIVSPVLAYAAGDYNYSIEDVFEAFANETKPNTDDTAKDENNDEVISIVGDYTLPTWAILRQEIVNEDKLLTLSGDEYKLAIKKQNIAKAITKGFGKSSKWAKFKKELESVCVYKKDTRELVLTSESTTTDRKFDSLLSQFDDAMLIASVNAMTEIPRANNDSKFVLVADGATDLAIGYLGVLIFNLGRVAMSLASLSFAAELIYVSTEISRPLLGFETQPKFFKKLTYKGEELGTDHSTVFRLVGAAARRAVAKEYEINSSNEVLKHNVLASFLWEKSTYMMGLFFGVAIIDAKIWGSLCTTIMSGLLGVF